MNSYENQNLDRLKAVESVQKEYRKLVSQVID